MSKMSAVFVPTVNLEAPGVRVALEAGTLVLRPGQWVADGRGHKGQYLTTRKGVTYVSWAGKGDGFDERTQRFCRANWHQNIKAKVDPVSIVTRAPRSLTFDSLREWFRTLDAKMRAAGVKRIARQRRNFAKNTYADMAAALPKRGSAFR